MNEKKNIKALIIDDEQKARNILNTMITHYCPEVEVVGFAANIEEAEEQIKIQEPNLLFLDVEMPYGTGFDLLRRLPKLNFEVVFVTGFDHYALKSIKFHALDYLLKPVDIDELIQAVHRVEVLLQQKQDAQRLEQLLINLEQKNQGEQQIAIPTTDGREFIPIEEIIYCQADGSCTWFHLKSGRRLLSATNLGEYEKLLPNEQAQFNNSFFRVHYSSLVNCAHIKSMNRRGNYVEMKTGAKIDIAQRRKPKFIEVLRNKGMY